MSHNKFFIISPMIMGMIMSVCVSMNVLAASNYAIFSSASVAFDTSQTLWVFFGTGDKTDVIDTDSYDRLYAVKDSDRSTTHIVTELTSVNSPPTTCTGNGWVDNLSKSEKVLAAPIVYDKKVYYTTYKPSTVACSEEGNAFLYVRDYICGAGQFSDGAASANAGTGTPSGAVISTDPYGNYNVYVATSSHIVDTSSQSHTTQQNDPSNRYTKIKNMIYWKDNRVQ